MFLKVRGTNFLFFMEGLPNGAGGRGSDGSSAELFFLPGVQDDHYKVGAAQRLIQKRRALVFSPRLYTSRDADHVDKRRISVSGHRAVAVAVPYCAGGGTDWELFSRLLIRHVVAFIFFQVGQAGKIGHPVEEDISVEMVDLVLDGAG